LRPATTLLHIHGEDTIMEPFDMLPEVVGISAGFFYEK
jgi:hypothetical protein